MDTKAIADDLKKLIDRMITLYDSNSSVRIAFFTIVLILAIGICYSLGTGVGKFIYNVKNQSQ